MESPNEGGQQGHEKVDWNDEYAALLEQIEDHLHSIRTKLGFLVVLIILVVLIMLFIGYVYVLYFFGPLHL